ncbi:fungal-specific transcription factor domain-containing protein [Dipodascopsis tothii]|uniref:fungal-specific transcription factor domain-containing protein n=1 Tax=Dipodascopsis tothii TaxID=44089 RepID=UPI0034CF2A36
MPPHVMGPNGPVPVGMMGPHGPAMPVYNLPNTSPDFVPMQAKIATTPDGQRALYFLNLVFAIGVAVHQQQYPALLCESYHAAAMKFIEPVFASPNRLESLQGVLLLGLYSIMRPAVPGVWYVLGVALRLCVDLGLHVEGGIKAWSGTNVSQRPGTKEGEAFDAPTLDLRRRLFWCTYAMDRQVCVYLGRPFGIADNSIRVPFPSELDDVFITTDKIVNPPENTPPSYKTVAVHIFQIRRLQSEVQTILYERAELPRRFATLKEWQIQMARRLEDWYASTPKSTEEMNCNFNLYFIDLNYHQTRLLLHGISPAIPRPSVEAFFIISDASEKIIRAYRQLHRERNINYTWMAVHNLFMAGTSYLYCLYHSREVRSQTRMDVIDFNTMACIHVLTAMVDRCDAASGCRDTFELLTAAILRLCYNEKAAAGEIIPSAAVPGQLGSEEPRPPNGKTATPPVPPPMPPPARRSRKSPQYDTVMEGPYAPDSVSPNTMNKADPILASANGGAAAGTPNSTGDVRTPVLSPFANFESNTLQWMTDMEPDLDEIFRTAAEIQAVPPMHTTYTHPMGGNTYQFSPSAVSQTVVGGSSGQYMEQRTDGRDSTDQGMFYVGAQPSPAGSVGSSGSPSSAPTNGTAGTAGSDAKSAGSAPGSGPPAGYVDEDYDGQRIYEMMYEIPSASIWDQFFAVPNNTNFSAFGGPSAGDAMANGVGSTFGLPMFDSQKPPQG